MAPNTQTRKSSITIEFLEDGLVAFGSIWEKGQRKTVEKDSRDWGSTINRRGEDSWLLLSNRGQMQRWGKVYFKKVPNVDLTTGIEEAGE